LFAFRAPKGKGKGKGKGYQRVSMIMQQNDESGMTIRNQIIQHLMSIASKRASEFGA